MAKRPGHTDVVIEVGVCSFCGRSRNLRREEHKLGALSRVTITCETCHRTLSSFVETVSQPSAAAAAPATPAPTPAKPAPKPKTVASPAAKRAPAKTAATKTASATKATAAKKVATKAATPRSTGRAKPTK